VRRIAKTAARLAGLPDPDGHAARAAAAFLPDVLTYRPGQPAGFHPGDGNGRAPGDNPFDAAVAVIAGPALANASTPRHATPAFPSLSAPQPADLPPLAGHFRPPQTTGPVRPHEPPDSSAPTIAVPKRQAPRCWASRTTVVAGCAATVPAT